MLPRVLLLTVVVACGAPLCAAQWPCPNAIDIKPCLCTADAERKLTMECSEVHDSGRLGDIFQTHFSFNDFERLIIEPTNASASLQELPSGVFGPASFKKIDISSTRIHTIEEQAFANSHTTLERFNLASNQISSFPFETLDLFTVLTEEFDISYNKLSGPTPNVVSDTLLMLDMSGNSALTLTETAFQETPYLEEIYLNAMQLGTTTPPNVFKTLKFLRLLNLESNGITGELIEDLINPVLNPITSLSFNNNKITQIHHLAITGMQASGTVHLRNNKIEYLHQANWETLVTQLNTAGAIDVRDNPLVCGCDVKWLVFDKDLMAAFHIDTTCATGNKLAELPQDWFLDHCLS